jgi:putative ABC transport system substrate-binding protein
MIPCGRVSRRRMLVSFALSAVMLLCGCSAGKEKVFRVGVICGSDAFLEVVSGFQSKMSELGYVEGRNIVYDMQKLNADPEGELQVAKRFVQEGVDLVFAVPTEPSVAARDAAQGTEIPLVFAYAGIEGSGLVESVSQPGGQITGVRFPGPEQISKRLEILLEFVPRAKRVWIGYDKNYPNTMPALKALRTAASSRGVRLVEVPAATIGEMGVDLAGRTKATDPGVDAIILMPDIFNHCPAGWDLIRRFAAQRRLPIGGSFLYTVEQGAIFGNANDLANVGKLAAPLADKILRGASAGMIPVVTPEQDLWINYKAARDLGLTVPEGLLQRAKKIIR